MRTEQISIPTTAALLACQQGHINVRRRTDCAAHGVKPGEERLRLHLVASGAELLERDEWDATTNQARCPPDLTAHESVRKRMKTKNQVGTDRTSSNRREFVWT